jgi:hypothetical protein
MISGEHPPDDVNPFKEVITSLPMVETVGKTVSPSFNRRHPNGHMF